MELDVKYTFNQSLFHRTLPFSTLGASFHQHNFISSISSLLLLTGACNYNFLSMCKNVPTRL